MRQDDYQRCIETYKAAHTTRLPFALDYHLRRHDGEYRWVLCNGVPFYEGGVFAGLVGCCVDISDQLDLQPTEARRDAVRALNHKLKNSLQTSICFSAYGRRLSDRSAQRDLTGVTERLSRLALAHDGLTSFEDGQGGFSAYLELLATAVHAALARPDVALSLRCEPVTIGSERASAVGRVVDELLTTALTQRFPEQRAGTVHVASHALEDGRIEIVIADDGAAASAGADGAALSFQRQLLERLIAHADGTIRYETGRRDALRDYVESRMIGATEDVTMAKGQKRSSKEIRKPKQEKVAAPVQNAPFANAGKPGSSGGAKKK